VPTCSVAEADPASLAPFRDLQMTPAPQREGLLIAEGAENVRWLLTSGLEVLSVLAKPTFAEALASEIAALPTPPQVIADSRAAIDAVLGYAFTRGVLACARRPIIPSLEQFLERIGPGPAGIVLLDCVHDHANVGATIRNARCFGLSGAVLSDGCADPYFRKAVRVSVGHVFHLPLAQHGSSADAVRHLRKAGFQVFAAHRGPLSRPLQQLSEVAKRWCLVLGNEDRGPLPETLAACDGAVYIEMATGIDSLNVAAAGAVLMHALATRA
jgi:tRNA G18 (ribose-2'-O)-methylase SpoU